MPMPSLDPDTYVDAWLADPAHKLPLPDKGGRQFFPLGEKVNRHDQFYAALIVDGSLVLKKPNYLKGLIEKVAAEAEAAEADDPKAQAVTPEPPADTPATA